MKTFIDNLLVTDFGAHFIRPRTNTATGDQSRRLTLKALANFGRSLQPVGQVPAAAAGR